MNSYKLNNQNLFEISKQVAIPQYNRPDIKTGIVHIGIGGFHRAHQAYYTDQLLQHSAVTDWGICGIALLEFDTKIYTILREQDGLYTLIIKELDGSLTKRVIGALVECLFAPENPMAVIEKIASPEVKIITLTITEGGYNYDEATGEFNAENPLIQHDIAHPKTPKTVFGYLTQALKYRKERGLLGCTIQSCDNIQGNGHIVKKMLLSYVKLAEPDLVDWITKNVSFPNSMVDRITPATSSFDIANLKETSHIEDAWPVVCESFTQWVIEDDFSTGRPAWEDVGVQFVEDVMPYEKMKLSLLNAGHSILGILGALLGYATIDEAINDVEISSFLRSYMDNEVTPILTNLEEIDLKKYKKSLIKRFGNNYIKDQIDRICSESAAKVPIFVLPTINMQLKKRGTVAHAALIIAAWAIYNLGVDQNGRALVIKDALKTILHKEALASKQNPKAFLGITSVFGKLKESEVFVAEYTKAYNNIVQDGLKKSIVNINNS